MSYIYTKLTHIINRISDEFHRSFLFRVIFSILSFIENQWVNSYFKKLYPGENFLGFVKKNKILNTYIFSPLIVLVIFAAFLLLSLTPVSDSLVMTIIIAFIAFFIGAVIVPKFLLNKEFEKPLIDFNEKDIYSIGFCLILVAIVFFFISVASIGGIPILQPSIRYLLIPAFTMPVFLIIPGVCILAGVYLKYYQDGKITRSQARFRLLLLTATSCGFLLALGYRTPLLAVLLIMIIIGYYGNLLSMWEVVAGAILGVCAIVGIGYFRSVEEYTVTTATNPFYTLQSRADFTLHVLDHLNLLGGLTGATHGEMLASSIPGSDLGPRMLVGKLIAWRTEVTVTPTLIGQMVADFGKIGVAIDMLILGATLGIGFKIMRKTKNYFYISLYSLILTYTILGVETGILDIQVLVYFIATIFIYLVYIFRAHYAK